MEVLKTTEQIEQKMHDLQQRLDEANDTIEAIRSGQVDALVVKRDNQNLVYTLKSADQTYRLFIEKMIEGAVTLNRKGIVLYSNSRFAAMMNLPLTKIIGSHFQSFVQPEETESFEKLIKRGWHAEVKGETCLQPDNSELIPVLVSLTTLELDEGTALSLIVTDLTAQKKIEKELKEKNEQLQAAQAFTANLNNELEIKVRKRTTELLTSREHFKLLANTIPVILWTAKPNGDYDYFNQQWYDYTGKNFEESKGKGWESVIHPDDLPSSLTAWNHSLNTGEPFKAEDRKRSADGVYYWHLGQALPFKDSEGNIISWFGVCTNIEDQKKAMETKDEFIAMASHELRTPVTSIKALTQLLLMDFEGGENQSALSMLTKMDKQVNKLTSLIGDLLDVSKANAGQLNFYFEEIDFNELVKEAVDEMQRTTNTHAIEVNPGNTGMIEGDRNRLEQVIMNLISNAVKYSPKANKVVITSGTKNNEVRFCVQDFGIGIPASQQPKLFTRFFRATRERKNTYPGLGLGLYISSEIVKRHSGVMDFISEEGKGSTFCFSLPLKK